MNLPINSIEESVLASFFVLDDNIENNEPFELDSKYFFGEFNKMLCERINKAIKEKDSMSLLEIKIEAWVRDVKPQFKKDWINISTKVPMPMCIAEKYYKELKIAEVERRLNVRR
jgi:hypothetical protein